MRRRTLLKGILFISLGAATTCLLPAAASAAPITITGQVTASDPDSTGRPGNVGSATTCASPAAALPTATGTYNYDAYTFQNASATTATCVTVTVSHPCDQNSDTIQFVAYLGSFNPTAPAANLAGKTGFGFCGSTPAAFSFNLPAGATFQVVLFASGVESGRVHAGRRRDGRGRNLGSDGRHGPYRHGFTDESGVLVRWRTGTQADLLGFHVYRSLGHSWRRVSESMIPAKTSVAGASYRFLDKTARRGVSYRYRLKAIAQDGTSSWFGPIRVT